MGRKPSLSNRLKKLPRKTVIKIIVGAGLLSLGAASVYVTCLHRPEDREKCLNFVKMLDKKKLEKVETMVSVEEAKIEKLENLDGIYKIYTLQTTSFKTLQEIAKDKDNPPRVFTAEERDLFETYRGVSYGEINENYRSYVKDGKKFKGDMKHVQFVHELNDLILRKCKLYPVHIQVFRGVGLGGHEKFPNIGSKIKVNSLLSTSLDPSVALHFMDTFQKSEKYYIGQKTIRDYSKNHLDACCFYQIDIPPKFPVFYMPARWPNEYEILLPSKLNGKEYELEVTGSKVYKHVQVIENGDDGENYMGFVIQKCDSAEKAKNAYDNENGKLNPIKITSFRLIKLKIVC